MLILYILDILDSANSNISSMPTAHTYLDNCMVYNKDPYQGYNYENQQQNQQQGVPFSTDQQNSWKSSNNPTCDNISNSNNSQYSYYINQKMPLTTSAITITTTNDSHALNGYQHLSHYSKPKAIEETIGLAESRISNGSNSSGCVSSTSTNNNNNNSSLSVAWNSKASSNCSNITSTSSFSCSSSTSTSPSNNVTCQLASNSCSSRTHSLLDYQEAFTNVKQNLSANNVTYPYSDGYSNKNLKIKSTSKGSKLKKSTSLKRKHDTLLGNTELTETYKTSNSNIPTDKSKSISKILLFILVVNYLIRYLFLTSESSLFVRTLLCMQ
jgi:hypothetical protein